jgi:hypothetical protein
MEFFQILPTVERSQIIPVMLGIIGVHLVWTGWCCWKAARAHSALGKLSALEKKLDEACSALEELNNWAKDVYGPLKCVVAKYEDCDPGSGSGWPPDPPGEFPPEDG